MPTVPDNRNEDNPEAADESATTLAGEGVGSGDQDEERVEPPTLDTLAREGARRMLMAALEADVTEYILLYLRGLSTGAFREALPALPGLARARPQRVRPSATGRDTVGSGRRGTVRP